MTSETRDTLAVERTQLAAERTHLANERTYLAWLRTAIAMIALGLATVQFLRSDGVGVWGRAALSLGLIAGGVALVLVAEHRSRRMRALIQRQQPEYQHPGTVGVTVLLVAAGLAAGIFAVIARR